jgi:hypothetical protein
MCPPLLALVPAAAGGKSSLSTVATVAGAGLSAVSGFMQGQAQQQAAAMQEAQYRAQADMQARQAALEQTAGQYQQRLAMERLEGVSATQRAIMAGSGFSAARATLYLLFHCVSPCPVSDPIPFRYSRYHVASAATDFFTGSHLSCLRRPDRRDSTDFSTLAIVSWAL